MFSFYEILEIKTFGLGSRIGDMALWNEPNIELSAKVCAPSNSFHNLGGYHAHDMLQSKQF